MPTLELGISADRQSSGWEPMVPGAIVEVEISGIGTLQ